ncbi:terpenoid synthase [Penicillium sp. IBT 18751x]|nr:terpenoid synthase [Penicillium sp. IBT 18751x]
MQIVSLDNDWLLIDLNKKLDSVSKLKAVVTEDLRNKELTYPVVLALNAPLGDHAANMLEPSSPQNARHALNVL